MNPILTPLRQLFYAALLCLGGVAFAQTDENIDGTDDIAVVEETVETGTLRIRSTPSGARVWVDHVEVGRTPLLYDVAEGEHTVRIAADFHAPYSTTARVSARRTRPVTAELQRGAGTVEIDTDIDGAQVTIRTRDFDQFPLRLTGLSEANYQYRVTAPGYEPIEDSFSWEDGQNVYIWLEMQSSAGRFTVQTDPSGATVFLDGEDIGPSPIELEGVEQGAHLVRIVQRGYADLLRVVDTSDGSNGDLELTLVKQGARVMIRTGNSDAVLLMDGVEIGTGRRIVFPRLERGRYAFEVKAPGQRTASNRVVVPARGFVRMAARLRAEDSRRRSTLDRLKPFYAHWAFWSAVGVTAGGATTGGVMYHNAIQPIPITDDDVDQWVALP